MRNAIVAIVVVFAAAQALVVAQAPDFSGTWALDADKSKVVATANLIGLIPAGAPKTLHVTQPANGTLVIESQINEGHVRIYKPGARTSTPAGQGGAVTVASTWDKGTLVSEGAMKAPNGDTTMVKEVVSLSADRKVLTIQITTVGAEKAESTLVYTKITSVGSCESWPTPCKRAG